VPEVDPGVGRCEVSTCLDVFAFLSRSQAPISSINVCLSGMRRSRHCEVRTASSGSARSSQLACFGGVPFETLDQAAGLDGRECFVERGLAVNLEIILDEHQGLGTLGRLRALRLLASIPFGVTETIMLAHHGFKRRTLTFCTQGVNTKGKEIGAGRVRITAADRSALKD
jgi:hypothetical protein